MKKIVYDYGEVTERECGRNGRYKIKYEVSGQDSMLGIGFAPKGTFYESIMSGIGYITDHTLSIYDGVGIDHIRQSLIPEDTTIIGVIEQVFLVEKEGVHTLHIIYRGLQSHQTDPYPAYMPRLQLNVAVNNDGPNVYAIDVLHYQPDWSLQAQTMILVPKENEQDSPTEDAVDTHPDIETTIESMCKGGVSIEEIVKYLEDQNMSPITYAHYYFRAVEQIKLRES